MTALGSMLDADELENRYVGKVIFYVESDNDENFYRQCVATGHDEFIEFKGFPGRGGYRGAIARTVEERKGNDRIFALVDGEASVDVVGGLEVFIACDTRVFQVPGETGEGVVYLAEHELENIFLRLADVCTFIANDEALNELGRRDKAVLAAELKAAVERQFEGAVCKYASMSLSRKTEKKASMGGVYADNPVHITRWMLRSRVRDSGMDWRAFVGEIRAIVALIQERFLGLSAEQKDHHVLRLCDGKTVMSQFARIYKVNPKWHSHLVMQIVGHPYFEELRDEILEIARRNSH